VILVAGITPIMWWTARRTRAGSPERGARWETATDLKPLIVRRPTPGRLTLGEGPGRRLLATEPGHSLLVLGPTQSGKTSGLAILAILEWPGPVGATSVKADLLQDTVEWVL
jgi:type IV secretory pathway TraG/TraD family ATPase VirD4